MTSVGEERERERGRVFFCHRLLVIVLFLFEVVCSPSVCLRKSALFYIEIPLAFQDDFSGFFLLRFFRLLLFVLLLLYVT